MCGPPTGALAIFYGIAWIVIALGLRAM